METSLIGQGVELMLFGMGTVIAFLTLLVLATMLMSALVERFLPEPPPQVPGSSLSAAAVDPTTLAIISAAIHQHRSRSSHDE